MQIPGFRSGPPPHMVRERTTWCTRKLNKGHGSWRSGSAFDTYRENPLQHRVPPSVPRPDKPEPAPCAAHRAPGRLCHPRFLLRRFGRGDLPQLQSDRQREQLHWGRQHRLAGPELQRGHWRLHDADELQRRDQRPDQDRDRPQRRAEGQPAGLPHRLLQRRRRTPGLLTELGPGQQLLHVRRDGPEYGRAELRQLGRLRDGPVDIAARLGHLRGAAHGRRLREHPELRRVRGAQRLVDLGHPLRPALGELRGLQHLGLQVALLRQVRRRQHDLRRRPSRTGVVRPARSISG